MISCPKCGKENQDHYKFCLGCGAELPRDAAPKPFSTNTPPQGVRAVAKDPVPTAPQGAGAGGFGPSEQTSPQGIGVVPPTSPSAPTAMAPPAASSGASAPASAAAIGGIVSCPQCSHSNAPNNVFCGSCGFRLGGAPAKAAAAPTPSTSPQAGGVLLTALRADGSEAGNYTLPSGTVTLGRDTGAIFAGDSYLSPKHATFRQPPGKLHVKDEASLNGVYRKLARDVPVVLRPNDVFRIGQEIIRFESLDSKPTGADGVERLGAPSKGYIGRISLVIGRDTSGNAFPIPEGGIHLGRERGDVLFPEDGYVSGLHCHLVWDGSKLTLTDLGSSNGTFVRIYDEVEVTTGDVLLMGQQLFRVTL